MLSLFKITAFFVFWMVMGFSAHSQSVIQIEKRANEAYKKNQFDLARVDFQQLLARDPESVDYNFKYAVCIFHSDHKSNAKKYFDFVVNHSTNYCDAHYYIGKIHHESYRFSDAIQSFQTYKQCDPSDSKDATRQIQYCQNGQKLLETPKSLTILSNQTTLYANFVQKYDLEGIGGGVFNDASLQTKWDKKKGHIPKYYFKRGENYKFFSSYGENGERLKLYCIQRISQDVWSKPEELDFSKETNADLDYPFFEPISHTLYFSSNGFNSMGGYDLFKVDFNLETQQLGSVQNLDFPFSSASDDYFFIPLNETASIAVFASNRNSSVGKVSVIKAQFEPQNQGLIFLTGNFKDEVDSKNHRVQIMVKDLTDGSVYGPFTSDDNGNYQVTLPGAGDYIFSASINGTEKIFENQKRIPNQKSNQIFKQTLKYKISDTEELAQFNYDFNVGLTEEMAVNKAMIISSLSMNARPNTKMDNSQTLDSTDTPSIAWEDLGFNQEGIKAKSEALADKLLEMGSFEEEIKIEIENLKLEQEENSRKITAVQQDMATLNIEIQQNPSNPGNIIYEKELKGLYDSLLQLTKTQIAIESAMAMKVKEGSLWQQANIAPTVNELSDQIKMALISENEDSLNQILKRNEEKITEFMAYIPVTEDKAIPQNDLTTLDNDLLATKQAIESLERQLAEIQTKKLTANKKEKSLLIVEENNINERLKKAQIVNENLVEQKERQQLENEIANTSAEISAPLLQGSEVKINEESLAQWQAIKSQQTQWIQETKLSDTLNKEQLLQNLDSKESQRILSEIIDAEMKIAQRKIQKATPKEKELLSSQLQRLEYEKELILDKQNDQLIVENTSSPENKATNPQETPQEVAQNPTNPENKATNPQETPQEVAQNPTNPENKATNPQENPQEVAQNPTNPENKGTNPQENPQEVSQNPTNPENKATNPQKNPQEVAQNPTNPENKATNPQETPQEVSQNPTNPENKAANPQETPQEVAQNPVNPENNATNPQENPQEVAQNPTNPENKGTNPQENPQEVAQNPINPENKATNPQENPQEVAQNPINPENKATNPQENPQEVSQNPTNPENKAANPQETPQEVAQNPVNPENKAANPQETPQEVAQNPTNPENKATNPQENPQEVAQNPTNPENKAANPQETPQEVAQNPINPENKATNPQENPQKASVNPPLENSIKESIAVALNTIDQDQKILTELASNPKVDKPLIDKLNQELALRKSILQIQETIGEGTGTIFSHEEMKQLNNDIMAFQNSINQQLDPNDQIQFQFENGKFPVTKPATVKAITNFPSVPIKPIEQSVLAMQTEYDEYVTLRKQYRTAFLFQDKLSNELQEARVSLYRSQTDEERNLIIEKIKGLVTQFEESNQQLALIENKISQIQNNQAYAYMLDQGVVPMITTLPKSNQQINASQASFSMVQDIKSQKHYYPILSQMPDGLVFRIQVGVFKNAVPDYFFREFTPVTGEKLNNALTAYLAGFFGDSKTAIEARTKIRNSGYKDAFMVAYCDGKRIPTALGLTYELQGNCRKRNQDDINAEVAKFFNDSIHQPTAQTQSPSEVYFTVQVAAIKKEDNGVLKGVPELHYNLSPKGLFKYSSGKFDDLALANLRKNELKKAGYNDAFIVAYRDGIPVSFREAEVALNFLKEPRVEENPTVVQNQNLEGTTLPTPKSIYYTFTKPQSLLGCQDMLKYNYHIPFSVGTDALHSGPILSQNLSPYLFIYYSDFEINKVDSSDSLKWVLSAPEDRLAMAHDFAVRSEIRYRVIKSENQSSRLVFYPESPAESSIVMNLAQQLNLEISKEGE